MTKTEILAVSFALTCGSCSQPPHSPMVEGPTPGMTNPSASATPQTVTLVDPARALAIADEYKSYGRVDDEMRWAPFLCRQPLPGVAQKSASNDAGTHGQKLYSVFAKDHKGYPDASGVGQVVVKESFKADLVTDPQASFDPGLFSETPQSEDHFYPFASKDGKLYRAGDPTGLFIMYRVDAGSSIPNDEGWVYATVSPDRVVTGSGRIGSCMTCHEEASHGRLFGVPKSISNL